jgi:DNA-binding transcriptional LysR family regulator
MEIWQIKYFISVCNEKSFSKAAKSLNITHQGLSKAIKNLEDELQSPLFERSSKGVKPTELGRLLLERSEKIVNEFDSMVDFLYDKAKLKKGIITVGLARSLHPNSLGNLICEFQDAYPEIKLEIVDVGTCACEKYVEENLLDISFTIKTDNTDKFRFIPLFSCNMMLLVNKYNWLAERDVVKFEDLRNEKFIMLSQEYRSHKDTIETCLQLGFTPNIVFTTSQIELIIELVDLNRGIAIIPQPISLMAIKISDKVSAISFEDIPFKCEVGFIMNRYQNSKYITNTFIKYTLNFFEAKK